MTERLQRTALWSYVQVRFVLVKLIYTKKTLCYRQWIEKYQWRSIFSDFLYFWQILKAALNECRYLLIFFSSFFSFSSSLVAAGATRCFLCWKIRKLSWFNNAQTNKLYKFSLLVQIGYYMVNVEFWLFLWNIPCSMWGADATKESLWPLVLAHKC